jgi:hypothetical protein
MKRREIVGVPAVPRHHRPTDGALQRGKAEDCTAIAREKKLQQVVAESTHAVIQNEMSAFRP